MPKLFDCDSCPRKLKCTLTGERDKLLKKWSGNKLLKEIWETFESKSYIFDMGVGIGIFIEKYHLVDDYNKFLKDFSRCLLTYFNQCQREITDNPVQS